MKHWYATNARDLLDARRHGQKPAGPVVVSHIGGSFGSLCAATLYVHEDMPAPRMDWRMLVNLEVWFWADDTVPLERVLQLLDGIAHARPSRLTLRFDHQWSWVSPEGQEFDHPTHDVDIGSGHHIAAIRDLPEVHEFCWDPLPLNHTPIERRLADAAAAAHPKGTIL